MISLLAAGCRCSAQAAVLKFKFWNCLITPPIVVTTTTTTGLGWVVSVLGGSNLHSATAVRTSAAAISSAAHNTVTVCHLAYSDVIDMIWGLQLWGRGERWELGSEVTGSEMTYFTPSHSRGWCRYVDKSQCAGLITCYLHQQLSHWIT